MLPPARQPRPMVYPYRAVPTLQGLKKLQQLCWPRAVYEPLLPEAAEPLLFEAAKTLTT